MKYTRSALRLHPLLVALAAILVAAVTARSAPLTDIEKAAIVILLGKNYDFGDVIKGRAIDGYVQGATVFLDVNGNGSLDDGEPSGVSGAGGRFEIALDEEQAECKSLAPVVANVPLGAIDETLGEVTEAFQMALPPGTEEIDSGQEVFITPLTSVLWAELYALYSSGELPGLSCSELRGNPSAQEKLQAKIDQVILQTVQTYNIPANELLSDYVASGSSDTQRTAEDIVAGLKLSLTEQLLLEQTYPDANSVRVVVERSLGSRYNDPVLASDAYGWYRRWWVQKDGLLTEGIVRLSEDLLSELYLLFYKEWFPTLTNSSGVNVGFRREVSLNDANQIGTYSCVGFEDAKVTLPYEQDRGSFEISTENSTVMLVAGWEACNEDVHALSNYSQNIFITERPRTRSDGVLLEQGYYSFDSGTGIPIPATKGLAADLERINADDLLSKIPVFDWRFYDGADATALFTSKHFEYQSTNKILIEKFTDPENQWRRVEYLPNNTVNEQWAYAPLETNLECIDWQQSFSSEGAFNITGDCTSATFSVGTEVGGGGELIPASAQEVAAGVPTRFLVCPNDGYQVASASDDCEAGGSLHGLTYVTGNTTKDCSVTVSFTQNSGEGDASCAAENTTPATVPSAPTALTAIGDNQRIDLSWNIAYDGGSSITDYKYSTDGGTSWASLGTTGSNASVTHLSDGGNTALINGMSYELVVRAVNAIGEGAVSESITATPNVAAEILLQDGGAGEDSFLLGWDFGNNQTANFDDYGSCTGNGEDCPGVNWAIVEDTEKGSVLEVSMSDSAVFAGVMVVFNDERDLSAYEAGNLNFDIFVSNAAANTDGFVMTTQCGYPCQSTPRTLGAVGASAWETVSIPISELVSAGLDLSKVNVGFNIYPVISQQSDMVFRIDNVQWAP